MENQVIAPSAEEINAAVTEYLQKNNIEVKITFKGFDKDSEGWEHDKWDIAFDNGRYNANFPYRTGLGLRVKDEKAFKRFISKYPDWQKFLNDRTIYAKRIQEEKAACFIPSKPEIAGVLYSILNEGGEMNFTDWCDNFGYDTDSRKAFKTYESCVEQWNEVRSIFSMQQVEELRNMIQDY